MRDELPVDFEARERLYGAVVLPLGVLLGQDVSLGQDGPPARVVPPPLVVQDAQPEPAVQVSRPAQLAWQLVPVAPHVSHD